MPIDTTNYMILGFAVTFVTMALHLASFPLRTRNLKADLQVLQTTARPAKKAVKKTAAKKTAAKKAAKKTAKRASRR